MNTTAPLRSTDQDLTSIDNGATETSLLPEPEAAPSSSEPLEVAFGHGQLIIAGSLTPLEDPQRRAQYAEAAEEDGRIPSYVSRPDVSSLLERMKERFAEVTTFLCSDVNEERIQEIREEGFSVSFPLR